MSFNSLAFFGFMAVALIIYPHLRHRRQNLFLLVASYVFYGYWDWRFTALLFTSSAVDFFVARGLHAVRSQRDRKLLLSVSITVNLGILCFFKYFDFFLDSIAQVLTAIGFVPHLPVLQIILPIGISFYTFKTLSYTIDVYRGKITATDSFVDYAMFLSFFPQLFAGPIERAANLLSQISTPRHVTRQMVISGLNLIVLGYFKKVAIADTLAPIVGIAFASPNTMSSGQLWAAVYAYTFQIYGDFSGYTDIARGIALLFGFRTMENFNTPYLSRSITEFWRRWHISLSTWFRDYLYIPLGGNRHGKARTYTNLIATMALCGLWHGAAWNFALWGLLHGCCLMMHRMLYGGGNRENLVQAQTFSGRVTDYAKIFLTFHLVALAWVLFRAPSLENALIYFEGLFQFGQFSGFSFSVLFAGGLLICLDVAQAWCGSQTWLTDCQERRFIRYAVVQILLVSIFSAAIAHLGTNAPFIYFQF